MQDKHVNVNVNVNAAASSKVLIDIIILSCQFLHCHSIPFHLFFYQYHITNNTGGPLVVEFLRLSYGMGWDGMGWYGLVCPSGASNSLFLVSCRFNAAKQKQKQIQCSPAQHSNSTPQGRQTWHSQGRQTWHISSPLPKSEAKENPDTKHLFRFNSM